MSKMHLHLTSRVRLVPLRSLIQDRSGATAVAIALALTGLAGLGGLATDCASWYFTSRTMQSAADAAAYTAAVAKASSESTTDLINEAKWVAASSGYNFVNGSNGTTVTVNNPPASDSHTSDSAAVEVIISQPQTALLSSLFLSSGPTITRRSVATAGISGSGCVLTLDRGNVQDLTDSGNSTLNLNSCSIYINSDDASGALTMSGNSTINTNSAYVVGGVSTSGNASLNTTNGTHTGATAINDPYASVAVPSDPTATGACTSNSQPFSGGTLPAKDANGYVVLCNGINLGSNTSVTLPAGVYIMYGGANGGGFSIGGNATLTRTAGVTIVLTGSGSNYATVNIGCNANVSITAPTTGATEGLAFFQDRNAPSNSNNAASFSGNGTLSVTGAIYFPNNGVTVSGNGGVMSATCTQLVAYTATFSGNSGFNNNCSGVGVQSFGGANATFVE
jgi:Flp pilus assembly protein TadG